MSSVAQPYVQYLDGYPQDHRNGGRHFVNNIHSPLQPGYLPATSGHGMPPSASFQYMPMVMDTMIGPTALSGDGGNADIPRPSARNYPVASASPSTLFDGNCFVPPPIMPQGYPQEHISPPRPLGYAEHQVPMPPLGAPQGSLGLPSHNERPIENLSLPYENLSQNEGNDFPDQSCLASESMRTTKRKRNMSPSVAKNKKRRKATVSAHTHTATGSKVQKPYKKDRDPANCPFCNREVSRSRRVQNHVRICKSVESSIRAHQFSGNEIIQVIRKWGIPDFMFKDPKASFNTKARRLELKDYIKEKRRCLKNLINSQSSDEQIVQVLREWNVPMLENSEASFGIEADKGSAPEARPSESYIHSVEAPFDSKTVVEDLMSSGSGASTPWDPYDTSSESSSSSQYSSEGSPTAHPAVTPGAEEQALWYTSNTRQFLSGATVALSGDQYDQYWTGFDNVLTFGAALPTIKYFGSGVLDEYGFDVSMLDAWETLSSYSGRSY